MDLELKLKINDVDKWEEFEFCQPKSIENAVTERVLGSLSKDIDWDEITVEVFDPPTKVVLIKKVVGVVTPEYSSFLNFIVSSGNLDLDRYVHIGDEESALNLEFDSLVKWDDWYEVFGDRGRMGFWSYLESRLKDKK